MTLVIAGRISPVSLVTVNVFARSRIARMGWSSLLSLPAKPDFVITVFLLDVHLYVTALSEKRYLIVITLKSAKN